MSAISNEEKKLEELIDKAVQRHLKLTFEDMEVVRRSPAAAIIRVEEKVEFMVTKEEFRKEINNLEDKLKREISNLEERLGSRIGIVEQKVGNVGERVGSLEGVVAGVKSTQKLLISLYLSILALVGAIFVKMFFFP